MIMVKLFANLRKIAGTKEVLVDLKEGMGSETGTNLGEVISALIENGKIRPHVIITINGHPTQAMDAGVTEQDQIAIFPPIAGG